MRTVFALPVVAAMAIGATTSAEADAFKPSQQQQIQLGKRAAQELRRTEKVVPRTDPRSELVRRVGRRLLNSMGASNEPWEFSFDVIESREVNAFALPGGPTFVYTGLLDKLKTEDELAGVMAHELTHVRREHWAYAYRDSQKRNLLLTLGLVLFKANRATADVANIATNVVFDLPFSRAHESQADEEGMDLMIKSGYNPNGMLQVFQMLRDQSKGGKPPEFLSDHPSDDRRISSIQNRIAEMNRSFPAQRPLNY